MRSILPKRVTLGAAQGGRAGAVVVVQPALPSYRVPMFAELQRLCDGRFLCLASTDRLLPEGESGTLNVERSHTVSLPGGLMWQTRVLDAALSRTRSVLIVNWNTRYLSNWIAIILRRVLGEPVLAWGHGYSKRDTQARTWLRDMMGKSASGVVFYDEVTAGEWMKRTGVRTNVFVCRNGLDQASIRRARDSLGRGSLSYGDRKTLVFCSRLFEDNQLEEALAALPLLPRDMTLRVIGDGPHRGRLVSAAEQLGVSDRVEWLGAVYDERTVATVMSDALACVYPANAGLSIVHAMAYGCPVLIGNDLQTHGPEARFVRDGVNGLMYAPGSPNNLADRIMELRDEPGKWEQLSAGALETASRLDTAAMAQSMLGAVEAVTPGA